MADIQEKILSKYGVNIAQDNILKLYKIDNPNISQQELVTKFQEARKRWTQSINGANEKNAARDKERLAKADKYEAILKDDKMRKEVFAYYNGGKSGGKEGGAAGNLEFARGYFKLLETSRKLNKKDVKFFFEYYQAERKNKKAILEMLEKEFKLMGLGKDSKYADENEENDAEGKKKDESGSLIVNLFQEATIFKIQKCFSFYETAVASNEICQRYPNLKDGLYNFIGIELAKEIKQYTQFVASMKQDAYGVKQERGNEYIPLVDLLNTLHSILEYRDVVDNFEEFKLLLKYPTLNPYMYRFTEMKADTFKGIVKLANMEYSFRDEADFVVNYYEPIHDNFGIINSSSIHAIIKKAQKKAKANKVLDKIDEKLGRQKLKKLPFLPKLLHCLVYWPLYILFFIFELLKLLFIGLNKLVIPFTVLVFFALNWLMPISDKIGNMTVLFKIFNKTAWVDILGGFFHEAPTTNLQLVLLSLCFILFVLMVYGLPTYFVYRFTKMMTMKMCKETDWKGYERTFQSELKNLNIITDRLFKEKHKTAIKQYIGRAILNAICMALIVLVVIFVPKGIKWLGGNITSSWQAEEVVEVSETEPMSSEEISEEIVEEPEILMVITASSANIRAGVGTSHDVVATGVQGQVFVATGNQETTSSGNVWYEIYLDEEKTQTGWASQKVIKLQEEE
ncbi:MAG: hypothetical protein IJ336_01705 [Lachnospiraceae bacterium]|nr:hypothetical protein [Lachnospiraceae bacterium]